MTHVPKAEPAPGYPPEPGCYLRGNDYSPVAVCVILRWNREETPADIEYLVRVAVETGAALAGTLQTENIGVEKMICNLVANSNIRYLVVCGPESPGHLVGDALVSLSRHGVDAQRRIIDAKALTPYLFNLPPEFIERFRAQVKIIDLINEGASEVVRQAVWACYQEEPTAFREEMLHDPGAFPDPPLSGTLTWRVTHPEREPKTEEERTQQQELHALMDRVRQAGETKRRLER